MNNQIVSLKNPVRVLFVCLGNICRSVTAEEIFRAKVKDAGLQASIIADSAGLIDYHEGELADPRMRQHAFAHGYRLIHRSRPVVTADFNEFDMIVAMDENNVKGLMQRCPEHQQHKIVRMVEYLQSHEANHIPDPYYGTEKDFEWVIELLEDACEGLLKDLLACKS